MQRVSVLQDGADENGDAGQFAQRRVARQSLSALPGKTRTDNFEDNF